jgi:hypothetical protein
MSILSSLLGITRGEPTQTIPTGVQTQEIAKEVAPFIKDILGKGQALYKQRMEEGFVPFEGKTLADVTAEQQQAQEGIRGLVGTQAPAFEEARGLVRGTTAKPTAEGLQEFMSPYQQAVIDVEKRRAQEAFERDTLPKVRQAQIASGAFGGTRGTLLEALALQDQARLLSDIETQGRQRAFESAQRAFEAQKQREAQAAQGLSGLAQTQFGQATRELGQLEAVGREQQQREQQLLDESYQRFLRERAFPEQQLAQYQGIVTGASPLIGATRTVRSPQQFQPSPLATALGTATGVANIYGAFSNPATFRPITGVGAKEGGPVIPAEKGTEGGLSVIIKMIKKQRGKGGDPRSKRSKAQRIERVMNEVTDMLEKEGMKAGGIIDLPVVKRQNNARIGTGRVKTIPKEERKGFLEATGLGEFLKGQVLSEEEKEALKQNEQLSEFLDVDKELQTTDVETVPDKDAIIPDAKDSIDVSGQEKPDTLSSAILSLLPGIISTGEAADANIMEQFKKTQEAQLKAGDEDLALRQELINRMTEDARRGTRQAVLGAATEGLLAPTVGGTGLGMTVRNTLRNVNKALVKETGKNAGIFKEQMNLLLAKTKQDANIEKAKLDALVTAKKLSDSARTQRLQGITTLIALQKSVLTKDIDDINTYLKLIGNLDNIDADTASAMSNVLEKTNLPQELKKQLSDAIKAKKTKSKSKSSSKNAEDEIEIDG